MTCGFTSGPRRSSFFKRIPLKQTEIPVFAWIEFHRYNRFSA
jgi:hypothetical protein